MHRPTTPVLTRGVATTQKQDNLGEGFPGERAVAEPDPFDVVEPYVRQRLVDDPHVWATVLFDELVGLGYEQSYPTFVRKIRYHRL